jgi:hypothetical protein
MIPSSTGQPLVEVDDVGAVVVAAGKPKMHQVVGPVQLDHFVARPRLTR